MGIGLRGWGSVSYGLSGYSGLTRLGGMRRIFVNDVPSTLRRACALIPGT